MNGKRLIYIIGAGRSGTTVLDIVLGNASGATSLGEVNRFFRRGGIPPARKTAEPTALFWDRFRKDFEDSDPEFSDYPTLQNLMHANEYHTAFFRWLFKKQDAKYARVIRTFYKLLEAQTPGEILIESSKYPMRAMNISRILKDGPFEIAYI